MPAAAAEKFGSRRKNIGPNRETIEYVWRIRGAADEATAISTMLGSAPSTISGSLGTLRITDYGVNEVNTSLGRWEGSTTYNLPDWTRQTNESVFTFDTTGGTQHISFSKANVGKYGVSGTPPDIAGAINSSIDDVGGCDITIPNFAFTATKYLSSASVTQTYIGTLFALTGQVNNATWTPTIDGITISFNTGEVLFLGATGQRRGVSDVEIGFHFAGSPNVTNLTVGGITGVDKKGWEYLWVYTRAFSLSGTGNNVMTCHQAEYVYVERVYDLGAFGGTGL